MGSLFGGGGAKRQARAIEKTAAAEASQDRLIAQAAQSSRETMAAQDQASKAAAELLARPQEKIDVQLAPDTPAAEIDPDTGRRRTTRSSFMAQTNSGIQI